MNNLEKLFNAINGNNIQEVKDCIKSGININVRNNQGLSALDLAIMNERTDILEVLIQAGADIDSMPSSKYSYSSTDNLQNEIKLLVCEVLGHEPSDISDFDNFFEIGADSLSISRLLNRIQQKYSVDVTYQDIIKNPTLDLLFKLIKNRDIKTINTIETMDI